MAAADAVEDSAYRAAWRASYQSTLNITEVPTFIKPIMVCRRVRSFRTERKDRDERSVSINDMPLAHEPLIFSSKVGIRNFKDNQPSPPVSMTALQNLAAFTSAIQKAVAVHEPCQTLAIELCSSRLLNRPNLNPKNTLRRTYCPPLALQTL